MFFISIFYISIMAEYHTDLRIIELLLCGIILALIMPESYVQLGLIFFVVFIVSIVVTGLILRPERNTKKIP
jgi:hypothetical protein